jgi:hypothetical protein
MTVGGRWLVLGQPKLTARSKLQQTQYLYAFSRDQWLTQGAKKKGKLLVHGLKKFLIIFGSMHFILQEFHRFNHT